LFVPQGIKPSIKNFGRIDRLQGTLNQLGYIHAKPNAITLNAAAPILFELSPLVTAGSTISEGDPLPTEHKAGSGH
jgi:hypothetical protein